MKRQINIDFLFLLAYTCLISYPVWNQAVWPGHDTIYHFWSFHIFYNNFYWNGELTRWLPFGTYGIPSDYWQVTALTPASYLTGLLGKLFQFKNSLLLFKASMLLEQWILLLGSYLLLNQLFRNRSATLFVCCGLIGSTFWLYQIHWNFRIYYLLPMILYFLIRFFREERHHIPFFEQQRQTKNY